MLQNMWDKKIVTNNVLELYCTAGKLTSFATNSYYEFNFKNECL